MRNSEELELLEDEAKPDEPEDEDHEELDRRYPNDGEHTYVCQSGEAKGQTLPRYCKCPWKKFLVDTTPPVECSNPGCLYWYHSGCTSDLTGLTVEDIENVKNWLCEECEKSNTQ